MKKFLNILFIFLVVFLCIGKINAELRKNPNYDIYKKADDELNNLIVGSITIPDKYDLRTVDNGSYLPNVGNQGDLSLCWAFAMNSTAESYALKKELGNYNFSENQLDIATYFMSEFSLVSLTRNLGEGYNFYNGTVAWLYGYGPTTEENFGLSYVDDYTGIEFELNNSLDSDYSSMEINSTSVYTFVPSIFNEDPFYYSNELHTYLINPVKEYIVKNGAIATSTFMPPNFGDDETEFVYTFVDLTKNSEIQKLYDAGYEGHALTIIGWDDHYGDIDNADGDNDHTTGAEGSWLVQNSWGDVYTYFYISYYDSYASFYLNGIESAEVKDYDYQYNFAIDLINNKDENYVMSEYYIGNNVEKVEKVKTYTLNADYKEVTVSIVSDEGVCFSSDINDEFMGMYYYTFDDCYVSGNVSVYALGAYANTSIGEEYRMVLNTSSTESYIKPELFVDVNDMESYGVVDNLIFNNSYSYLTLNLNSKNIPSFTLYDVKIYDNLGNDITSEFYISKSSLINNYGILYFRFLSSIDAESITISISGLLDENYDISFDLKDIKGDGTQTNPYLIEHPEDLILLEESSDYFKLNNDIDMNEITTNSNGIYYNEGNGWAPINFYGQLDGDGHTIYNLHGNSLFYDLDGATVKNLKIENASIYGDNAQGIIAFSFIDSVVENVAISNSEITSDTSSVIAYKIIDSYVSNIKIDKVSLNSENDTGILFNNLEMITDEIINVYNVVIEDITLVNDELNYGYLANSLNILADGDFNDENNGINLDGITYISDEELPLYYKIDISLSDNITKDAVEAELQNVLNDTNNQVLSLEDSVDENKYSTLDFDNIWAIDENETPRLIKFDIPSGYENIEIFFNDSYTSDDDYLYVVPKEEVSVFNNKVEMEDGILQTIYKSDGTIIESDASLKTGDTVIYSNKYKIKKYTIIILGDVNSDSRISVQDYKKVANYILATEEDRKNILEISAQLVAADVVKDNRISVQDYRKISNYILDGTF